MPRGKLICFAGVDGAGKTTVARGVANRLAADGVSVTHLEIRSARFDHPFIDKHMRALAGVIWRQRPDEPQLLLGHLHYFLLMVAWLGVLDRLIVRPALEADRLVIADIWYHKILARSLFSPEEIPADLRAASLNTLTVPDLGILLDISPATAATRKGHFTLAELGHDDGFAGTNALESFVQYQGRLRSAIAEACGSEPWTVLDVTGLGVDAVVGSAIRVMHQRGLCSSTRER